MRTIKFRAWDKKNHKILEALDLFRWMNDLADNTIITQSFVADESDYAYLQLPNDFVWMQFTGLLDKNGKEIYEGDIYKTPFIDKYRIGYGVVEWQRCGFSPLEDEQLIEVIGNIYENKELL